MQLSKVNNYLNYFRKKTDVFLEIYADSSVGRFDGEDYMWLFLSRQVSKLKHLKKLTYVY